MKHSNHFQQIISATTMSYKLENLKISIPEPININT